MAADSWGGVGSVERGHEEGGAGFSRDEQKQKRCSNLHSRRYYIWDNICSFGKIYAQGTCRLELTDVQPCIRLASSIFPIQSKYHLFDKKCQFSMRYLISGTISL